MPASTLVTDYIGRGVFASRPATPNIPTGATAFYYATDTTDAWIWDGSAWVELTTGASVKTVLSGNTGTVNLSSTATNFTNLSIVSATETNAQFRMPLAGTLKNLYVDLIAGSPGAGNDYAFSVRVNSATPATVLACSIADAATEASDLNGAHAMAVVAGDLISIQSIPTSSPTSRGMRWSMEFDPS